ncbi:hypothetical protein [Methylosarcina fibrata]|uniref:hypothetical protein n=1 Tax=Methylosarcina fibrata TaxID=105972 RepID=UPI000368DF0A|nr:hypothetical protein [Methylosarcina fibrata]
MAENSQKKSTSVSGFLFHLIHENKNGLRAVPETPPFIPENPHFNPAMLWLPMADSPSELEVVVPLV